MKYRPVALLVALAVQFALLPVFMESAAAQQTHSAALPAKRDTLVAISAGDRTTCITTASGAGYCWGLLGDRFGKVNRILDADGLPARLRFTSPGWFTLCAQTVSGDAACDPSLTGASVDSAGKWKRIASCAYRLCVLPLPKLGPLPAGALRAVDAGWDHACALALDGTAFCWGRNDQGQLGNGHWAADSTGSAGEMVHVPTAVASEYRFAVLSAGENTTCGISEPGAAIFCWGYAQSGQTGDSSVMQVCSGNKPFYIKPCSNAVPTRVGMEQHSGSASNVRFATVSVGMRLACAVSVNGDAYCWGENYRCALGRCREGDSPLAHYITIAGRVSEIGAGYWHACARTVDRRIFCWGQNTEGQLGSLASVNAGVDGLPPDYRDTKNRDAQDDAYRTDPCFLGGRCSPAPVEVSPGRRWSALAVGSNHACALDDTDGNIYCWGGTDTAAIGLGVNLIPCVNRSTQWKDVRCQAAPVPVPGLPSLVARAVPMEVHGGVPPRIPLAARVTVSRREVRVIFPRDEGTTWGWSALADPQYSPWYDWGISNNGMDGPRSLRLMVGRTNDSARTFSSLDSLVSAAKPSLCSPGMMWKCAGAGITASVQDNRVVLVLSDSARIARLFGLRPAKVAVWASRPSEERRYPMDSVSVQYTDPRIPPPDSAVLADAKASQRRYTASISSIMRGIASEDDPFPTSLWVAVGDSLLVSVHETRCQYDACTGETLAMSDSLWVLDDTSLAGLRGTVRSPDIMVVGSPSLHVVGRRPGRTTLRITLPPRASDSAPCRSPPERMLTRDIVVTRPLLHIELLPRPQSLHVNETIQLHVRAIDDQGRAYENPPARVTVNGGKQPYVQMATSPINVTFDSLGTRTVVARFGSLADTVTVRIVPAP